MDQYKASQNKALNALNDLKQTEAIFIKASELHKIINNAGCD